MFVDEVEIYAKSGDGGAGAVSFLREKFKPKCGPDGGDGGNGGNIYFLATNRLNTLASFRFKRKFIAKNGEAGKGKQMFGKNGEDLIIEVPIGTIIYQNEQMLFDLSENEQKVLLLQGGKGGLGNIHFATAVRQTPKYAQPGLPGEEGYFKLELKILADVGLLGLPNAGKSTLLSSLTNARPKIGSYPFTTITPNLGVLKTDNQELVIADIPGLIANAHQGVGLGIKFLKHIERTKMLIHLVDILSDDLEKDIQTILTELSSYSIDLTAKKRLLVFNKIDSVEPQILEKVQQDYPQALFISAVSRQNIQELIIKLLQAASG